MHKPALLLAALVVVSLAAVGGSAVAAPPPASPESTAAVPAAAAAADSRWQPATDYDGDGCYPAAAMDASGTPSDGLELGGGLAEGCRDAADLGAANVYVRTSCASDGWCARMYAYYFEKDQVVPGPWQIAGHVHDLEHVIVWTQGDSARYVSASAHGDYDTRPAGEVRWEGDHPKIVYHKDGIGTHAFRFATDDDEPPENHAGTWQRPALLGWDLMPSAMRETVNSHSYGAAIFDIRDSRFADVLAAAAPDGTPF